LVASFPPTACYSAAHHDGVGRALENLERYETIFIDSLSAASTLSFRWAEQQPESFSASGKKDLRGTYGLHGRETLLWLSQQQPGHWHGAGKLRRAIKQLRARRRMARKVLMVRVGPPSAQLAAV